jgi:hypothetical protein
MMPRQLARGLQAKRQSRRREQRPIVEQLPFININDLRQAIPRDYSTNIYANPFRYPQIRHMRLSYRRIEIVDHQDRSQVFGIAWISTYFGKNRAIIVCNNCRCGALRLFSKYGSYACRHCHRALYASQKHHQDGRKRLAACKLRLQLGGLPDISEPIPAKPKWKHHKTYNNARKHLDKLETPIKSYRFGKRLNSELFAYHST